MRYCVYIYRGAQYCAFICIRVYFQFYVYARDRKERFEAHVCSVVRVALKSLTRRINPLSSYLFTAANVQKPAQAPLSAIFIASNRRKSAHM